MRSNATDPATVPAPAAAGDVLHVEDLCVAFDVPTGKWGRRRPARVVDRLNLTIGAGEIVALVGESGSGKSTTARGILRLVPLESGRVILDGSDITTLSDRELRPHRRHAQMVFQDPYSSLDPAMTVADLVTESLRLGGRRPKSECYERSRVLLENVGMRAEHLDRYPAEFSGGQRQRIAIARALAPEPRLIVCDEAVSALDVSTQNQIIVLLRELRARSGVAILFISHDLGVVRQLADRTVVMYCGQAVETGPTRRVFSAPAHPYTRALLAAVPVSSPRRQRERVRIVLTGDPPNPLDPPSGCRFHTRCPVAMDVCRRIEPPTVDLDTGGQVACHLYQSTPLTAGT